VEITKQNIDELKECLKNRNESCIYEFINELRPADIAEIIDDELNIEEAKTLFLLLDEELAADVLVELEDDVRKKLLEHLSDEEIAETFDILDTDDAVDIYADLPEERKQQIIAKVEDKEQAEDIIELSQYEEGTAGALMAKELFKVNVHWTAARAIREMRKQAEEVSHVYTIYVVDDENRLLGTLSLKSLLFISPREKVESVYMQDPIFVKVDTPAEEVAQIMQKYNLVAVPVVDEEHRLLGRITIDDVVDFIQEEAEKDYQLAAGISENVDTDDSVWILSRARLPWLLVGLVGEMFNSRLIANYEGDIQLYPQMAFYMPLIAAMGGNSGVQSSAIVVQGLANNTLLSKDIMSKLSKEFLVSFLNGLICAVLVFGFNYFMLDELTLSYTISLALFCVIMFASIFGAFVPLMLDRFKIDPALATGPFVTTMNDVLGIFIYFLIGKLIYFQ
jgi:magnesium transporter